MIDEKYVEQTPKYVEQTPKKKGHKVLWIFVISAFVFLTLVIALVAASSGSGGKANESQPTQPAQTTQQPAQPTQKPKQWVVTKTISGNGNKRTETFALGEQTRLLWKGDTSSFYGGSYNLIVEQDGADGTMQDIPINTIVKSGNISGETMLKGDAGSQVQLSITSEGAYTITVETYQ
jgi:hypothetical protein